MAKQKEDAALSATHFIVNHRAVGPFANGKVVAVEELNKWFGRDKDATPEEHTAHLEASLKRLLTLGAITPTEAPPDVEEDAAKKAEEQVKAAEKAAEDERKAFAEARKEQIEPPKSVKADEPHAAHAAHAAKK